MNSTPLHRKSREEIQLVSEVEAGWAVDIVRKIRIINGDN
jgi:hypothetical protein